MAEQDRIRLEIVTPEREVFHAMVEKINVPALIGSTGILYNHAPLLTVINPGVVRYVKDGTEGKLAVGRGFLEVRENEAEMLVSSAEIADSIDVARAIAARDRAKHRLQDTKADVDIVRAQAALSRAMARLSAAGYSE